MKLRIKPTKAKPVKAKPVKEALTPARKKLQVMGLDVSLRHTGVVILDQDATVVFQGTIDNPKPAPHIGKLGDYNEVVKTVVKMIYERFVNTNTPVIIAREDYAYAASSSSETTLKELGGILEWEICKIAAVGKMLWVPVATAKKFATTKGNAQKAEVMKEVFKRFSFDGNEHESDAFAVAGVVLEATFPGVFANLAKQQKEAVSAFTLPG